MHNKTHELDSSYWRVFCQRVSEQLSGSRVKVEGIKSDGVKGPTIANATFLSMVFDDTGACNNIITLRLMSGREIVHEILEPIYIRLNLSEGAGDFNPLEIKAESGITTITFHPAIRAQTLAGLGTA